MTSMNMYQALPSDAPEDDSESTLPPSSKYRSTDRLFLWACIACCLSTILSFTVFLAGTFAPGPGAQHVLADTHPAGIRRPNPYINLDRLDVSPSKPFSSIVNFPRMVLQIDAADSSRTMKEDHRSWQSEIGKVYPYDRHILVTSKISTILHFRHLDFGMESCTLNFTVPKYRANSKFDPAINIQSPSRIDVWVLDSTGEISRYIKNTWRYAPRRRSKLTSLVFFDANASQTVVKYRCPFNQFTTLELACATDDPTCQVDFWQNFMSEPQEGIHLVQHPSDAFVF